ncbi:TRAP transporter small permease [Rhodobaculum claviforme]|uniref:TRAP transporter small permease protein n=1 Tax=Rhodobaculum claviforme TaxID=1549854 RepID=A0A934WHK0_9RHOB|nr:TRAP transporter small permease [Rhodobaculum claviforme]MBK5925979.1 hypothetical protein [Rhodobaculum claviforme]
MRRVLDTIYGAAMVAACGAMVAIAALVLAQVLGRVLDRALVLAGGTALGLQVPSLAEIGGFLFVAATMLALPATLRAGGHVRVTLVQKLGGPGVQRALTLVVLVIALGLAVFAAWAVGARALDSFQFGTLSFGMVRVPLWIPQGVMALGLGLFALALADEAWSALRGIPAFRAAERARGTTPEEDA